MGLPQYIKDFINLPPKEEQEIGDLFRRENYSNGHVFFQPGDICRHVYFCEKGLARFYHISSDGKEITDWFFAENDFLTALDSFYQHKPTDYYCVLLEDSVIYSITFSDFEEIFNNNTTMSKFLFRTLYEISYKLSEFIFRFQTAQERYKILLQESPFLFQRVQLSYIASYLGITPETLSRLRAEK
jgi:CRP/FNR family transcriptional regulator, anaerobic regulatory protein